MFGIAVKILYFRTIYLIIHIKNGDHATKSRGETTG